MSRRTETIHPLILIAVGALVLAAGVWLARQWLPEWRTQPMAKAAYVQRYQDLARRAGMRLQSGEPRIFLSTGEAGDSDARKELDGYMPEVLASLGEGLRVQVEQVEREAPSAKPRKDGSVRQFSVRFLPEGRPQRVELSPRGANVVTDAAEAGAKGEPATSEPAKRFLPFLLQPGESLGKERPGDFPRNRRFLYEIRDSRPAQHLEAEVVGGNFMTVTRQVGGVEPKKEEDKSIPWEIAKAVPFLIGIFGIPILFVALVTRRRIDLFNGLILAGVTFLASALGFLADPSFLTAIEKIVPAAFWAFWVFLIWSAAESYLRAVQSGFATSLDSLRAGRLGPRGGRSLLFGLGIGAVLGGLRLAVIATASSLQGLWPDARSLDLPMFGEKNPFGQGTILAAAVALVVAFAVRYLPARWAPWTAALVMALVGLPIDIAPYPARLAANLALGGLLVFTLRRFGLTALLTATVTSYLLPAAVFSGRFLDWLPGTFAVTAGVPALFLVLGLVGIRRPERVEIERVRQPAFIRRLEEERRVKYEMDLLSRMQLGLLPAQLPEVPGWEIAARSLLATEAGGDLYDVITDEDGNLWIATGDVAGHGYSCAIAQAMTVAALTSLVDAARTPSEILRGVDRVIRRSGTHRHFTSLALMRLDSDSGDALLSNAGHPFPLLLSLGGEVLEIDLPGLPLGQGPKRKYGDISIEIPQGGALVFASDGLFEGADWQENQYGYERPQELLRSLGDASAQEILEALFADWRRHLGEREHQDDTTVLVIKRK
jgi:Stage II sporulation protein E (SpoIIE)